MAENEGLHLQLTADASSYISTINSAKNKLAELAAETKILKQGEKDIQAALAESKKKYGETSVQVDKLTADLLDNAREQEKLKQEIKDVNATLDKATKEYQEYGNSAKKSFDSVSQQSQKTADTLKSGFNAVKGLIVGYAGKTLYEALIGSNADYEQSMVSFEVLLQSADKADAMMQKLEKMGASTPFELSDLTAATVQLLAYGTAEADVETKLQQLGDLSKGNVERFQSMTNAYGRMLAKGKVSLEELNMFTEAGVPILEELQNQYGVTGEEMYKMISNGKVGVEEINAAMQSMTGEGGQFFGMMEKQSKTLEGMMSTMSDNITMFGRLVGEETFEILKTELESLLATINEMSESGELQAIAQDLGQDIASAITYIIDLVKWLYEMKDILIAGGTAIVAYKTSFTLLNSAVASFNRVKELFNIITGKTVVCKNLETGATVKLTAAEYAEAMAKDVAIAKQSTFNAVCNANVYVAIASLVLGMVAAFVSYNAVTGDATENTNKLTLSNKELADSYNSAIESIDEKMNAEIVEAKQVQALAEKIIALGDEYNDCEKDTDAARQKEEEFKIVAEQLGEHIPEITSALYDETGAINVQSEAVLKLASDYITLAKAKARATAYEQKLTETYKLIIEAEDEVEEAEDGVDKIKKQMDETDPIILNSGFLQTGGGGARYSDTLQGRYDEANNVLEDAKSDLKTLEDEADRLVEKLALTNTEIATIVGNSGGSDGGSGGDGGSSGSGSGKSAQEFAKELYEARRKASDEYIKQRDFYDDWGEDDKVNALTRIMSYTDDAYKSGILTWGEYCEEIGDLSEELYSELQDMVEDESKRVKEQLEDEYKEKKELMEDEYKTKKQLMEDELEFRKQMYDKEMDYLDELKAKREDEKEDEDYAERMARLQAKLEYEMDDDNRRALQKEIDELQQDIDDTEFEREIERKKNVLQKRKNSEEEKTETAINFMTADYEKGINELAAYYEKAMSDVNIADTVYKNLDFEKFREMGEIAGERLAFGITGGLEPFINAINKLVTLSSNVQSYANNTVTTDNSIAVTQNINGTVNGNLPPIKTLMKGIDDALFLHGRLGIM